ncbi:hypothetical protein AbraIFM66951_004536 [Aspergillus brasiliensis]|uniref:Alcohol dehydrogenase-like N-terminal domain-containing protein n=1 Tax=Aspergillus brasiliensis TaxID=319629 RepID=A0A9W5Z0E1_9EURO|nr:hypothetical protein AbraCBS73388_003712 [Aspergillus brasiliensis]GKZ50844.1 hypothetical protein AbraIFM66951_004536 [Aspergillus brasiliensis]
MPSTTGPTHMWALRLTKSNGNYKLRKDIAVPQPGDEEVLVRVHASGFCHTDYQVYQGVHNAKLPMLPSHEPAGTIAVLGPNMRSDWKVGERVGVISLPFV